MFGSAILDVAVGFSIVYFSFSLLCSSLREGISRLLHERERDLVKGIYRLLGESPPSGSLGLPSPAQKTASARNEAAGEAWIAARAASLTSGLAGEVLGHSMLRGLAPEDRKLPVYIPSRTFAHALLDTLAPSGYEPRSVDDVRAVVQSLPEHLRQALLPLVDGAGKDIVALQHAIERRFDDAMDRVSGWYTRRTQVWIFLLALVIACVGNVDTIAIGSTLWRDPTVRAHVVARAAASSQVQASGEIAVDAYQQSSAALRTLQVPIGWDHWPGLSELTVQKVVGLLLTTLALLLGAPFWFQVLSKLANLRAAGPKARARRYHARGREPMRGDESQTSLARVCPLVLLLCLARCSLSGITGSDYLKASSQLGGMMADTSAAMPDDLGLGAAVCRRRAELDFVQHGMELPRVAVVEWGTGLEWSTFYAKRPVDDTGADTWETHCRIFERADGLFEKAMTVVGAYGSALTTLAASGTYDGVDVQDDAKGASDLAAQLGTSASVGKDIASVGGPLAEVAHLLVQKIAAVDARHFVVRGEPSVRLVFRDLTSYLDAILIEVQDERSRVSTLMSSIESKASSDARAAGDGGRPDRLGALAYAHSAHEFVSYGDRAEILANKLKVVLNDIAIAHSKIGAEPQPDLKGFAPIPGSWKKDLFRIAWRQWP
jgi:hypothetical protein